MRMLVATFVASAVGCDEKDCDQTACERYQQPQSASFSTGLAGYVAEPSDLVSNGCRSCYEGNQTVYGWKTDTLVSSLTEVNSLLENKKPTFTIAARGYYSKELTPGNYMICPLHQQCVTIELKATQVVTLNIENSFGGVGVLALDSAGNKTGTVYEVHAAPEMAE